MFISASQEIKKPKLTLDLADDDDLPILNNPEPPVRQSTVYRPRDLSDPKVLTLIHTESLLNQFRNSQPIESEPLSFDSDPLSASTSPKSTILVIKVRTNKNEHDISKFRIYSSDPFSKLERGYRDAKKLSDKDHVIFKLYGIVIDMHKTPADAEIADSDIIDAIVTKGISEKSLTSVLDIEDDEVPVKETNEPDTSNPVTEVDDYVSLKFRRDDKDIIKIKVSKNEKFDKIFNGYCTKKSLEKAMIKFIFDGSTVSPNTTPQELDMETDDIIDVAIKKKK